MPASLLYAKWSDCYLFAEALTVCIRIGHLLHFARSTVFSNTRLQVMQFAIRGIFEHKCQNTRASAWPDKQAVHIMLLIAPLSIWKDSPENDANIVAVTMCHHFGCAELLLKWLKQSLSISLKNQLFSIRAIRLRSCWILKVYLVVIYPYLTC